VIEAAASVVASRPQPVGRPLRALAWPGLPHLVRSSWYSVLVAGVFVTVYAGADLFARSHTHRADLSLAIDRMIPFVPEATLLYSSLYLMFALAPFMLRTERQIQALAHVLMLQIVVAAPFFLALPMPEAALPARLGRFDAAFRLADTINLRHNQFPSLHATFALTLGIVLGRPCARRGRVALGLWSAGIAAATLLTGQHVAVDVAGAFALTATVLTMTRAGSMLLSQHGEQRTSRIAEHHPPPEPHVLQE
jgi:membrane-associated phospholipid phosphatase